MEGQSRFNERYRVKGHLAGGAHGIILWAVDRSRHGRGKEVAAEMATGTEQTLQTQYAVKRIFTRNRVVPVSIIREIKSLQFLAGHPNVSCKHCSNIVSIIVFLEDNRTGGGVSSWLVDQSSISITAAQSGHTYLRAQS